MHKPTELERIVERQVAAWDSQERLSDESSKNVVGAHGPRRGGPWLTISQQLGSGGVELASAVAARLGWRVFNKELLHAIASRMHVREVTLSRIDGIAIGVLQDYFDHLFVPDHPGRPAYAKSMIGILSGIAREGRAVIVGRGANWLLDPADGLRVRVIAPEGMRAEWLVRTGSVSAAEAQRRIKDDDANRAAFIRQTFNKDIDHALGYDLVINRGTFEHEAAVETVLAALERKLQRRREVQPAL